jgi:hypothetical protein
MSSADVGGITEVDLECIIGHLPTSTLYPFALVCRATRAAVKHALVAAAGLTTTAYASVVGSIPMLEWAMSVGAQPNMLAASAVEASPLNMHVLEWLHAGGHMQPLASMLERLTDKAAVDGRLDVLEWTMAQGNAQWRYTCMHAASGGQLAVLQWARAHGFHWDATTCSSAADGGHLDVLIWARTHGCQWDVDTCLYAAEGGHLETLKWARANGCPWDDHYVLSSACEGRQRAIVEWLSANGCPLAQAELPHLKF